MPRYYPNSGISDCWGSAGDVTFYHRDGVCYFKKKPATEFAGTPGQLEQAGIHQRALEAWRGLDHSEQLLWNAFSVDVPSKRPPYKNDNHISGYNLFVSAYHGFAQLGDEKVPEPRRFEDFPVFDVSSASAEVSDDGWMRMSLRVSLLECEAFSRYRVAMRVQLAPVGAGVRPGLMRSYTAVENCSDRESDAVFLIPGYRDVWNLDLKEYTVHVRCFLIDTLTGYRVRYQSKSFMISI